MSVELDELLPEELVSVEPVLSGAFSIPAASLPAIDPSLGNIQVISKESVLLPLSLSCSVTEGVLTSVTLIESKSLNVWITLAALSKSSLVSQERTTFV